MDVLFRSAALAKNCNDARKGVRKYGALRFREIRRRLDQLRAADTLAEVPPSAGCHPLKGGRAGQFAVLLDGGWRLIFAPTDDPLPQAPGGGLDLNRVTMVEIREVTDYHG